MYGRGSPVRGFPAFLALGRIPPRIAFGAARNHEPATSIGFPAQAPTMKPKSNENPNREILDEINTSGVWFRARKTAPLWAKVLTEQTTVQSLEGPVQGEAGEFLCRGAQGEFWPQSRAGVLNRYEPSDDVDEQGFRKYLPRSKSWRPASNTPFAFSRHMVF